MIDVELLPRKTAWEAHGKQSEKNLFAAGLCCVARARASVMISFRTADKIEAASFSGSAERQTVKRRHAAIASRLQAVIRSVESIVQPDAHDVAVEACRSLPVVHEKGPRTATVHRQLAVEGHTAQIIVQIFDLGGPVRVEHPLETAARRPARARL